MPASLIEEMDDDMAHEGEAVANALFIDLIGWGLEGPIDKHGAADDVFPGNEAPIASIEAFSAVISHRKYFAGRNDKIAVLDVIGKLKCPGRRYIIHRARWDCREVIAIWIIGVLRIAIEGGFARFRLVLGYPVEIHDSVAEMDMVAGDTDGALHQEEVRGLWIGLVKDDDVASADVAVVNKGCPIGGRGEGAPVDKDMVADQKRLGH